MDTSITSPVRAASGTASPEPNPRGEETPWPRTRGTLPLSHTPPLPLFRPRRGMSLLEALATLVLVAVLVPASMQAVTISMRAAQQARQQQEASLLAESRLNEVIAAHHPSEVALERVFVNVNPHSTLLLGQARGTAICAAVMNGLPVAEYTALQVKQAVVGKGHAQKRQVQDMVKRLLVLAGDPFPDAADALACAICHAHGGRGYAGVTRGRRKRRWRR